MVQPGEPDPKIPPSMVQAGEPDPKTLAAMVQTGGADNKRKAAVSADDPNAELNFPIEKALLSGPALYAHQNAHCVMQEPIQLSPLLIATMLNNPIPLKNRPSLMPPPPPPPAPTPGSADPRRLVRVNVYNHPCAGGAYPRFHPYPRQQKGPANPKASVGEEEEVNSYDIRPNKEPRFHHHPYDKGQNPLLQALTTDLRDEWIPIARFGQHGQLGSFSGRALQNPAPIRREAAAPAHSGGSSSNSCEALDLDLKLGF